MTRYLVALVCVVAAVRTGPSSAAVSDDADRAHVLMVFDTNDSQSGAEFLDTSKYMVKAVHDWIPPSRLDFKLLVGDDASPQNALDWLKQAHAGPNDSVFVYYCGHGFYDPQKGQYMRIGRDRLGKEKSVLLRSDLLAAMGVRDGRAEGVRSAILVTDCCADNEALKTGKPQPKPEKITRLGPDPQMHRYLFFRHRGVIDCTSAKPKPKETTGVSAWIFGDPAADLPLKTGGVFSYNFREVLFNTDAAALKDARGVVTWEKFGRAVVDATNRYEKGYPELAEQVGIPEVAFSANGDTVGGPIPESPYHYRLGLNVFDQPGSSGVAVRQVMPDSPAEWMGFKPGQLLEKVFLFRDAKQAGADNDLPGYARDKVPPLKGAREFALLIDHVRGLEPDGGEWIVCVVRDAGQSEPKLLRVKLTPKMK